MPKDRSQNQKSGLVPGSRGKSGSPSGVSINRGAALAHLCNEIFQEQHQATLKSKQVRFAITVLITDCTAQVLMISIFVLGHFVRAGHTFRHKLRVSLNSVNLSNLRSEVI